MHRKMSSLVTQTEKCQSAGPGVPAPQTSVVIFRMSPKLCNSSSTSSPPKLSPPYRKRCGAYRLDHGCSDSSSLAIYTGLLLYLLCTSSLLAGASLHRHSSSSLLNLIGQQQSPAVASSSSSSSFAPSSGAASLSTSSQSLLSSTSSNAKLLLTGFSSSQHNLKGQSGASQSLDDEPQRWHTVSAFVGGEVSLPCAIDVAHCGRVYFITWTKNGTATYSPAFSPVPTTSTASVSKPSSKPKSNGDWQRVFIHSDSFESVLGDLEANGPAGRVSFGPKEKMNATNFIFLTVKSVTASDEGVYKCDVTYVKGKCPSLTYTRVQTLVKPSPPKIRVNGKLLSDYRSSSSDDSSSANSKSSSDIELLRHRQIGPFEEGSTIVFECSTVGGRPMPELRWYNGSRPLRSKLNIIESPGSGDLRGVTDTPDYLMNDILEGSNVFTELKSGKPSSSKRELLVATTRIIASRYDLGAKFECRVLWNNSADYEETAHWSMHHRAKGKGQFANASLLHEWLLLDIKVRPLGIKVESPRAPVVNGETVMLRCHVDGARPAANITWYNRSEVVLAEALPTPHGSAVLNLSSKEAIVGLGQPARTRVTTELMTDGTYKSTSILVFSATRSDHQADFFCKGSNEVLRNRNEVPLLQGVQLQVLYPPIVAIEPDGVIPVNETSSIQLWCTFDANPANISETIWFKDGQAIDFERWSAEKLWTSKDERGTPILTVNDIDRNDSAEYRCRVKNHLGVADSLTSAKLEVAYPPVVKLEILEPPSATVIESSVASTIASLHTPNLVSFRCITTQGNPATLTQVFWFRNGHHFVTSISLKQLQQSQSSSSGLGHHFYRVGTGKHFTLVDDATSVGPVNGASLRFNESTTESQPMVQYLESPDILTITNISRVHAGNYSCVGFNGAASSSQRSTEKVLSVRYKPGKATLSANPAESYVLHGTQALLECTVNDAGNPRAHSIQWTFNGVRIDRPTEEPAILNAQLYGGAREEEESGPLTARYRTAVADLSTAGQYACAAVNDLGEGQWGSFQLEVKSPPKLVVPLPATLGAQLNESISLLCAVECEPLCTIQWFHNNLTLLSPDSRGVFASSVRNELRAKLRNGNELPFWIETSEHQSSGVGSTYSVTESKLHLLNTSALFDHDQLSCASAGNHLGTPATSTVVFRREFAPHSVHISQPQIDLLEGERYPEKPIQCSAFGNPPPNYYWTFSPFHNSDSRGTYSPPAAVSDNNNVVAIGPMLTLNMTTMGSGHHHPATPGARVATESIELFGTVGSTSGPSLFRASRVQSGNYTCVASNRHGVFSSSMIINVFYRPECELRRIHTAKLFKQHSIPSTTFPNGSHTLSSTSTHFNRENEASHVLISCSASSNPAPMSFSWFRRNGTSMMEIHPSPETDHSLFVAIQDYDYDDHDERIPVSVGHQMPYQADQTANSFSLGHTRSSAVLSVPEYAHLEEYACLVTNLIGKSEPCWFENQPAQGRTQPEVSTWSWLSEENLFVVAATAGIAVFLVVASGAVVVVVCMHKNRTPSFKGFGTGSSSGSMSGTPQRFKLERPAPAHHLLDSSPDMDIDFVPGLDNRSKTATLTAGYRMVPGTTANGATQNGTLGKSYRTLPHHPYAPNGAAVAGGSVYGGSSSNGSNGGSRPFLVSYASSNVYAEPEYHCGASNHSGDQLTGSTTVTNASGTQLPGAGVLGLPPSSVYTSKDTEVPNIPKRVSKYGSNQEIYENNYGPTYEELDQANSRYYYQPKAETEQPQPLSGKKSKKKSKKSKKRLNKFGYKSGESPSSSSLGSSSGEDPDEPEDVNSSVDQSEETPSRRRPDFRSSYAASKLSARPSYVLPQEPSSDSESTQSNSAAYNPERDFYYATGHLQSTEANTSKMYEALPPSGAATNARFRRMLPPNNKYGSLVRQSSAGGGGGPPPSVHSPAAYRAYQQQPQQFPASPISTRIYFNFEGASQGPPSVTHNPYNSLRYGSPGVASHWSTAGQRRGSSPQGPMRTFNRASTQSETLETPPDYHRVFNE